MESSGFQPAGEPGWSFVNVPPSEDTSDEGLRRRVPGSFAEEHNASTSAQDQCRAGPDSASADNGGQNSGRAQDARPRNPNKTYSPRTCRICLEVVQPTFHPPSVSLPRIFQSTGYVTYESEDAESGRLIRPCKCKGSSRYVHEACLQQWRYADASFGTRNYWQCPTCGFKYRLQRMNWGRWINNVATQIGLTLLIFVLAIFIMGFVADPIINLYLDPYDSILGGAIAEPIIPDEDDLNLGWFAHLFKGVAGLGVLGFLKVMLLSPWQWWNLRQSGLLNSGRRGGTAGRDRVQNLSWLVIMLGVGTFLWVSDGGCHWRAPLTTDRLSTKVSGPGVGAHSRKLQRKSWTYLLMMMTTMTNLLRQHRIHDVLTCTSRIFGYNIFAYDQYVQLLPRPSLHETACRCHHEA
jgi:hypothetical protein